MDDELKKSIGPLCRAYRLPNGSYAIVDEAGMHPVVIVRDPTPQEAEAVAWVDTKAAAASIAWMIADWYKEYIPFDQLPVHLIEKCLNRFAHPAPAPAVPVEGAPDRIWVWEGDGQDGWDNAYATTHHVANDQVEYVRADIALYAQPAPQVKAVPWKVWDKLCHLFAETLAHVDEGIIYDENREAFFALKNEALFALSEEVQPAPQVKALVDAALSVVNANGGSVVTGTPWGVRRETRVHDGLMNDLRAALSALSGEAQPAQKDKDE